MSDALTSCFITFLSWTTVGVFPLPRVIQVGHSIRDLLVQMPELSFSTWTELHIHLAAAESASAERLSGCRRGKSLQGFPVAPRAKLLPSCTQTLGNLLGNIPAVFQRHFPRAQLDLLLWVIVGCDGSDFTEGMACRRDRNSWWNTEKWWEERGHWSYWESAYQEL